MFSFNQFTKATSTKDETRRSSKVSELVKHFEEKSEPPDKKTNLVRDVFRSGTSVERFKNCRESYMKKMDKTRNTRSIWYVNVPISNSVDADTSNESSDKSYAKNSNSTMINNQKNDNNPCGSSTNIVLRSLYQSIQNYSNVDARNSTGHNDEENSLHDTGVVYHHTNEEENKISISDIKLLRQTSYLSNKSTISNGDLGNATMDNSREIKYIDNDNIVNIREQHVDVITTNLPHKEIERTNQVVSWIKDSQFCCGLENINKTLTTPVDFELLEIEQSESISSTIQSFLHSMSSVREPSESTLSEIENIQDFAKDLNPKPHLQIESKHIDLDAQEDISETERNNLMHGYENIEIFRKNLQREIILIDNIERLNDDIDDSDEHADHEDNTEEIPSIQYINNSYMLSEDHSNYRNDTLQIQEHAKSVESLPAFAMDEVDSASKEGMFGKGNVIFKIRTSYWEVINPLHNKNAPEQFFNEVNRLTLVQIDIAKYIKKSKDDSEESDDAATQGSECEQENPNSTRPNCQYHSEQSLPQSCRVRNDSTLSIGSGDYIIQDSDPHSSTENIQPSTDLVTRDGNLDQQNRLCSNDTLGSNTNIASGVLTTKSKTERIVDELIKTESNYLIKLELVRNKYIPALCDTNKYPSLKDKTKYIFLNWNSIYMRACEFYQRIDSCEYNYEKLARNILNSVALFDEYSIYCKNKALTDQYLQQEDIRSALEDVQNKIDDKLGLYSYLLEPVQRLTKYTLFLMNLKKELSKIGGCYKNVNDAIDMIKQITSESNDSIAANNIKNLPFMVNEQGRIICKGTFNVVRAKNKNKWNDVELFLFEKVLIITSPVKLSGQYIYKEHIFMEDMILGSPREKLIVCDYTKNKLANDRNYQSFICTSKCANMENVWKNKLNEHLMMQYTKMKDERNSSTIFRRKKINSSERKL